MNSARTPFNKQFFVISYDIVEDRSRNRIFKILKGYGIPVQKSVFECQLSDVQLKTLVGKLRRHIDEEKDSLRIYRLCSDCRSAAKVIGLGEVNILPLVKIV